MRPYTFVAELKDLKLIWQECPLFLEQIEEGLTVAIHYFGRCGATSLLFNEHLGIKRRAEVVHAFVHDPDLDRLRTLVAG